MCAHPGRSHLCVADKPPRDHPELKHFYGGLVLKSSKHPCGGFGIADDGRYLQRIKRAPGRAEMGIMSDSLLVENMPSVVYRRNPARRYAPRRDKQQCVCFCDAISHEHRKRQSLYARLCWLRLSQTYTSTVSTCGFSVRLS